MASLKISHVSKRFGDLAVVRDINLDVADGDFVVLVGPSGCGKSTLLRMIAGLDEVSEGTIEIGGRPVEDVAPSDRDVAMVFQGYALYPNMTVRENISFGLRLRKAARSDIDRQVRDVARSVGLEDLLDRKPRQLSGGQRQRVAMARAIVRKPAVFLFDEPLSNLDAKLRVHMRAEIAKLHQLLRTTTIYVTHDQIEAMTLAQTIVVLDKGSIQQVGSPMDLYRAPANVFVAGFIGSPAMALFDVAITAGTVTGGGFSLPLPPSLRGLPDTTAAVLGIRPEHFSENGDPDRSIDGRVELVEPLGADVQVMASVGGQPFTARLSPTTRVAVGDQVRFGVALDHVHVFDKASGLALPRAQV